MSGHKIPQESPIIGEEIYTVHKNRRKKVRAVVQLLVLLVVVFAILQMFFTLKTYEPYAAAEPSAEDHGFIALSYFGVDRIGDSGTRIGQEQLRSHLEYLRAQGYVTITQRDILAYYQQGKSLPERSLYLMFEDGRRDTAIFAQEIMEDLNLKATIMTYPEKFALHDTKFLKPRDLRELEESSFWEMGTNGYRLAYINAFDRYGNFLGELDPLRFAMVSPYLGRHYNHYLMDYIRDADGVPEESDRQMKERISRDYMQLRDVYEEELGYVPLTHVLLHANTGRFGNHARVSAVNEHWIRALFPMNFNREGYVLNERGSSLYDLTRMQPQPYWPINHLIMRIKYDTQEDLPFVDGPREPRRAWDVHEGALELREETLYLTTLPEGSALACLSGTELRDLSLEADLEGNAFGAQQIYLRSRDGRSNAICIQLVNDALVVEEIIGGVAHELYREKIPVLRGDYIPSVEEEHRDAMVRENEAFARYASPPDAAAYLARAEELRRTEVGTVADGAEPYEGTGSFHRRALHHIVIRLRDEQLSIVLDGQEIPDIIVRQTERGGVCLGASWQGMAWSQRNLADDVYDGVFRRLNITTGGGRDDAHGHVVYTSAYTGLEQKLHRARELWNAVVDVFLAI